MSEILIRFVADGFIILVAVLSTALLWFGVKPGDKIAVYSQLVMAGMVTYLLAKLVSVVYQPELLRPFQVLGVEPGASYVDNPGFPSDHMLFGVFLVFAVWYATKKWQYALALGLLTVLMGLGRVLALVHTPLDVIGGAVIAGIGSLWLIQSVWLQRSPSRKKHGTIVTKR